MTDFIFPLLEKLVSPLLEKLVSPLLEKLTNWGIKKAESVASVRENLLKLEGKLKDIQPFLRDALDNQFTSTEIKDWVSRLNAVVYDAEDVIDLYRVKTKTDEVCDTQTRPLKKVRRLTHPVLNLPSLNETANEIMEINERLDVILRDKLTHSVPVMGESRSSQTVGKIRRSGQTISRITEPQVFGREKDEQLVVEWLKNERGENTRVVAIVGMAGCGKTTLAQKVFHNPNIYPEHFEKRMWVCVSEEPQESVLFKMILEEAVGVEASGVINGLNPLCSEIIKHLKEKRFLLVLDDVWDHRWWKNLNAVLQVGAVGSKVLITTRKKNVAMKMDASYLHQLKCLSDDESWSLFKAKVLRRDENEEVLDGLNDIGRVIVEKCKGLPLALDFVGKECKVLLGNRERTVSAWQEVAGNNNKVLSEFEWSYINLPFPSKQCFTYCCIFPKDFKLKKDMLVRLWVAEGLVSKDEPLDAEASAERYLEELVDSCLIEKFEEESFGSETCYKLHDIVHDFALVRGQALLIPARFLFSSVQDEYPLEDLGRETKLRTLLFTRTIRFSLQNISLFRWLRVLDLNYQRFILAGGDDSCVLPESLGELALLKYLSVNGLPIASLPESTAKLSELQRLDIGNTPIKMLPEGISQMNSLRHLHLGGMSGLKHLPKEIGRLTFLQTLDRFIVGSDEMGGSGRGIAQLRHLNSLRGSLHIQHIERVGSRQEANEAELKRKVNLQQLELSCDETCIAESDEEFARKVEGIYEELLPPTGLKALTITNYAGTSLPAWLSTARYQYLEDVTLVDCRFLEQLPSLGCLPNLVRLCIEGASNVKIIDDGFHGGGRQAGFPKLERLSIRNMESLEEWSFNAQGGTLMPRLKFLDIYDCPKLRALPDSQRHMTALRSLEIALKGEVASLPEWVQHFHQLEELSIRDSPSLTHLPGWLCEFSELRRLYLFNLPELRSLPDAMRDLTRLEVLWIVACPQLEERYRGVDKHKISHIPEVQFGNAFSFLISLSTSFNSATFSLPQDDPIEMMFD